MYISYVNLMYTDPLTRTLKDLNRLYVNSAENVLLSTTFRQRKRYNTYCGFNSGALT